MVVSQYKIKMHSQTLLMPSALLTSFLAILNKHPLKHTWYLWRKAPQKHPQRRREWVSQVNTTLTLSHKYIYTSLHIHIHNIHALKLMSSIQRLDTHVRANTH